MATRKVKDFTTEVPGELQGAVWTFPAVESVNAHKRNTRWVISVTLLRDNTPVDVLPDYLANRPMPSNLRARIIVESGVVGGKIRDTAPTYVYVGKNLGKKSETNLWCQALQDAKSMYDKQRKKAAPDGDMGARHLPMLAKVYSPVEGPVFVQAKMDGLRTVACLEGDEQMVATYSRKKSDLPGLAHIRAELRHALIELWAGRKVYLDGEVYLHGMSLQTITGHARREVNEKTVPLDYYVFDCFLPDEPDLKFSARMRILEDFFARHKFKYTKLVSTYPANGDEEVQALYHRFLDEKLEGAMVRLDAPYVYSINDYHCDELLKVKPAFDAEFPVVGWETSTKGKTDEALMIRCMAVSKVGKETEFPCTPKMTIEARKELAAKMPMIEANNKTYFENHWLGKMITVTFDAYSDDGVPLRARTSMHVRID